MYSFGPVSSLSERLSHAETAILAREPSYPFLRKRNYTKKPIKHKIFSTQ